MVKSETCRDADILVRNPSPRLFGEKFRDSKKVKTNHEKTRLWDLSKTLLRFRDPAKIFRDPRFLRYHSPPLLTTNQFIAELVYEIFIHIRRFQPSQLVRESPELPLVLLIFITFSQSIMKFWKQGAKLLIFSILLWSECKTLCLTFTYPIIIVSPSLSIEHCRGVKMHGVPP